ncbi:MAG: glycosyl hydrolase family 28 protein [Planctomycetia bacterium]|nr:glycosyl hydrolase family 28 protein [Planctomycetia bacterium]
MKYKRETTSRLSSYLVVVTATLACLTAQSALATVTLWHAPSEEPKSQLWKVVLENTNEELDVLTARTADPPFEKYNHGGEYGIVSLDANESVVLLITELTGADLSNLRIRPDSKGIDFQRVDDHSVRVKIDQPCQLSVEYDGRNHPLLLFVNAPETIVPDQNNPNVVYYGPGIHEPKDSKIELTDNQHLYLAPGAIVKCGVHVTGSNVSISGRGIIDSNSWDWGKGPTQFSLGIREAKHVSVDGIIIRGSSRWTLVPVGSEDVTINNVKICGGRVQNDDGINPCNTRRMKVTNTFVRSDDDCMALKGLGNELGNCEDIEVDNCVFWCDRARIVLMGHESRADYMRRITFRNIDVIHHRMPIFLLEPGEEMKIEDVTLEKIRVETNPDNELTEDLKKTIEANTRPHDIPGMPTWLLVARPTINQYMHTQSPGHIKGLTYRDVTVTGAPAFCGVLVQGYDEEHRASDVLIDNVTLYSERLTDESARVLFGDYTDNLKVE